MGTRYGGKIVTDGLVLSMDAVDIKSSYVNISNHDTVTELAFVTPGGSGEELIEVGDDPWGKRSILDRSVDNDATSNYDGAILALSTILIAAPNIDLLISLE